MLKEAASTTRDSTVNVKQLFDLTGRVAIVTGGSIGLGRQMAEGLAEMGAMVGLGLGHTTFLAEYVDSSNIGV